MGLSAEAYARQLKQLLPRGLLWKLEEGSWLSKTLLAISDELARIDGRSDVLVEEWDPRTTVELLADWERVLGQPELGMTLPTTTADRQVNVARAYVAIGGATPAFFVALALRAGFVAAYDEVSAYTWRLTVTLAQSTVAYTLVHQEARADAARAEDRVESWTVPQLEPVILRAKPAHTTAWFVYL